MPEQSVSFDSCFAQGASFPIRPGKDSDRLWLDAFNLDPRTRETLLAFHRHDISFKVTISADVPEAHVSE